jgi:AcrR family transcriptional regulator
VALTAEDGWSALTMSSVAGRAGVSRQTVYNDVGNRDELGKAMVLTELSALWGRVEEAFDAHPDDLIEVVREGAAAILVAAPRSPVLRSIMGDGSGTELLRQLTTEATEIIEIAKDAIRTRMPDYPLAMEQTERAAAMDTIVRLVFSHLTRPGPDHARAADDIAWVARRLLTFA